MSPLFNEHNKLIVLVLV